jgi:hypothetical protein
MEFRFARSFILSVNHRAGIHFDPSVVVLSVGLPLSVSAWFTYSFRLPPQGASRPLLPHSFRQR